MTKGKKTVDRFPEIKTAGRPPLPPDAGVPECLRFPVAVDDVAEAIASHLPKPTLRFDRGARGSSLPSDMNYRGYYSNVRELMTGEVHSGFRAIMDELRETAYKTYWNNEVGAVPDQVQNLPVGMSPESTVFGHPPRTDSTTASELINPKKSRDEVEAESETAHRLYCKSHNSYFPGEQTRKINLPEALIYGRRTPAESSGAQTKKILQWIDQSVVSTTSQSLAEYKKKLYYPLGKSRERYGIADHVTEGTTFGKPSIYGDVLTLKSDREIFPLQVAYVYNLKNSIKKANVDLVALSMTLRAADRHQTLTLPRDTIYAICRHSKIFFDVNFMDGVLERLNLMTDSNVKYIDFVNLLNCKISLPDFGKVGTSDQNQFVTCYMKQCRDLNKLKELIDVPTAGQSTFQPNVLVPPGTGWCLAHLEDLPTQTTVDDVIRPNIFTLFGLTHLDLMKPRSEAFIRNLVDRIGLEIPEDVFKLVWKEGIRRDGTFSVETLRNILDEISTGKLQQMSKIEIDD